MRERKAARLLVINPDREVLLFRFVHKEGALAGDDYWATPGGGLEQGETFEAAAIRELFEETGIRVDSVAQAIAERTLPLCLPNGEWVLAAERYFVVHASPRAISRAGWTAEEAKVMADHRWWSASELKSTRDIVWPETLIQMLVSAGVFSPSTKDQTANTCPTVSET